MQLTPRWFTIAPVLPLPFLLSACLHSPSPHHGFRAGAAVADITPTNYPVIVNAMFLERSATNAHDPLHVRALVIDDGSTRLALAVVDTCMMPRTLIDEAKRLAAARTKISVERMLVSATHTHSTPSAMGCLGSRADTNYAAFLPGRIAEAIETAAGKLAPARVGWTVVRDYDHTFCRRWIYRPDKMLTDPFGEKSVRANMHPGHENPNALGPSGPVDPDLSLLSIQTRDGRPLALLANYSMHYYESPLLSADYFGLFANKVAKLLGAESGNGPFVGIMSQGTSGDQMWMDYGRPRHQNGVDAYAQEMAEVAATACRGIVHRDDLSLAMRESRLKLNYRLCDSNRLAWARGVVSNMNGRLPKNLPEVYAQEQVFLHERRSTELVFQALRIGDLGITAIPNEVYAITGLKLKAQSPLRPTMNIELANGAEGYIPPPEQHRLGGYTTWAARTAGLEVEAEPRIVEELLKLLESVAHKPRRKLQDAPVSYSQSVLASKPAAYWRLNDFSGPTPREASGRKTSARFVGNVAYHLDGPSTPGFASEPKGNRAPHLAGGYLDTGWRPVRDTWTVEFWFWNALSNDVRRTTGILFSDGSMQLLIGGADDAAGRLVLASGANLEQRITGKSVIHHKHWNHLGVVRTNGRIEVYLNGRVELESALPTEPPTNSSSGTVTIGGARNSAESLEGKIDEVVCFDRVLRSGEISDRATTTSAD